jgi:peptide deformylase
MEREILLYPDPRLEARSEPVTQFDASLERLAQDLIDTLHANPPGAGLSAPQIGELKRVLVMDLSEDGSEPEIYVNPRIRRRRGLGLIEEGCLSIPGVMLRRFRYIQVEVEAVDLSGQPFERTLDGAKAVILQHELEHFEGRLLVDGMWFPRRLWFDWRLRARRAAPPSPEPA